MTRKSDPEPYPWPADNSTAKIQILHSFLASNTIRKLSIMSSSTFMKGQSSILQIQKNSPLWTTVMVPQGDIVSLLYSSPPVHAHVKSIYSRKTLLHFVIWGLSKREANGFYSTPASKRSTRNHISINKRWMDGTFHSGNGHKKYVLYEISFTSTESEWWFVAIINETQQLFY